MFSAPWDGFAILLTLLAVGVIMIAVIERAVWLQEHPPPPPGPAGNPQRRHASRRRR